MAKLNAVLCQVFEADLEEQDGKVIKSRINEKKKKKGKPRTNNHSYPLHDPEHLVVLPFGTDTEDHVQTTEITILKYKHLK